MNVVYSSDQNYVQHMGVSLFSLYQTNLDVEQLSVYIIANEIQTESKQQISSLAGRFNRHVTWIDFQQYKKALELDMEWNISLSAYARLFLPEMLPQSCDKVIYLDCDTIVCESLLSLWECKLHDCSVAGVEDLVIGKFKKSVGLQQSDRYFNSGVLLIDLKRWREDNVQDKFLRFIASYHGRVAHHDQGVINGVLSKEFLTLPPQFNSMTPFFTFHYGNLLHFYELERYYCKAEIANAKRKPVIIHYTPEFVGRPWERWCSHPKTKLYRKILSELGWDNELLIAKRLPFKHRLLYGVYKKVPVCVVKTILK